MEIRSMIWNEMYGRTDRRVKKRIWTVPRKGNLTYRIRRMVLIEYLPSTRVATLIKHFRTKCSSSSGSYLAYSLEPRSYFSSHAVRPSILRSSNLAFPSAFFGMNCRLQLSSPRAGEQRPSLTVSLVWRQPQACYCIWLRARIMKLVFFQWPLSSVTGRNNAIASCLSVEPLHVTRMPPAYSTVQFPPSLPIKADAIQALLSP
jgi:hypothetical protein